jgi:hypothetical protein
VLREAAVTPNTKQSTHRTQSRTSVSQGLELRLPPLAVAQQMLLLRLTLAIFIALGNAVARRCNLPGRFWFYGLGVCGRDTSEIAAKVPIATRKNNALITISPSHFARPRDAFPSVWLFSQVGPGQP